MAAVDWPDLDELKRTLDVEGSDWDDQLERQLAAGIALVKQDVGSWDESTDTPNERLAAAALRAAVLLQANAASRERFQTQASSFLETDEVYAAYIKGHRRTFGFA